MAAPAASAARSPSPSLARFDRSSMSGAFGWMWAAISSLSAWNPPVASNVHGARNDTCSPPSYTSAPTTAPSSTASAYICARVRTEPPAASTVSRHHVRYSGIPTGRPRPYSSTIASSPIGAPLAAIHAISRS